MGVVVWQTGGVLAAAPSKPNIVVEDNVIADNGLGIYLGWQGDWNILVKGNKILENGEGVRIVNRLATLEDNVIARNVIGIQVTSEHQEEHVTEVQSVVLRGNEIFGNELYALLNLSAALVKTENNWWGSPEGPTFLVEHQGTSDEVYTWAIDVILLPRSFSQTLPAGIQLAQGFAGNLVNKTISLVESDLWITLVPRVTVESVTSVPNNLVAGHVVSVGWLRTPPEEMRQ